MVANQGPSPKNFLLLSIAWSIFVTSGQIWEIFPDSFETQWWIWQPQVFLTFSNNPYGYFRFQKSTRSLRFFPQRSPIQIPGSTILDLLREEKVNLKYSKEVKEIVDMYVVLKWWMLRLLGYIMHWPSRNGGSGSEW